jgi:hypothetical protein
MKMTSHRSIPNSADQVWPRRTIDGVKWLVVTGPKYRRYPLMQYSTRLGTAQDIPSHRRFRFGTTVTHHCPQCLSAQVLDLLKWRRSPPSSAEFFLHLHMTPQHCDAIVGDLEERYTLIYKKFDRRRAIFWYWFQTVISLRPIIWAATKKMPKRSPG